MQTNGVQSTVYQRQSAPVPVKEIGRDEFLRLLIVQLQNQDPLEPMKNQEFVTQLAQMNSVEQLISINKGIEMLGNLSMTVQAAALVGTRVTAQDAAGRDISGYVSRVEFSASGPVLLIGAERVPMASITSIGL
jgi:flagellar basal-body rod modification protein FlgD